MLHTRNQTYVGLDTATVTGVAIYQPHLNLATLFEIKGDGVVQLEFIFERLKGILRDTDVSFVMEELHNFRNAVTTRNLLERYGYIKWSLISFGYPVAETPPAVARSLFGCKNKEDTFRFFVNHYHGNLPLTSNHTDALAIALYQADQNHHHPWDKEFQMVVEPPTKLR